MVLRAVSALPSVQLPSASTSPSTHFVRFCTFYTYIFAAIFVYISVHPRLPPSVDAQRCLYSTPTLIYSATASFSRPFSCTFLYTHAFLHLWTHSDASILHLHSSVDVQRSLQCYLRPVLYTFSYIHAYIHLWTHRWRLYSTPTLICGCTAVSTVLQLHFRGHFRVHLRTSTPTLIAAHHLPCFQGGKECMATLHSSDRDFTLLYILYILHLRLANIFVIQASIYVLHSTSTFSEHFRDPSIINIFANSAFKKTIHSPCKQKMWTFSCGFCQVFLV